MKCPMSRIETLAKQYVNNVIVGKLALANNAWRKGIVYGSLFVDIVHMELKRRTVRLDHEVSKQEGN